MKVTERKNPTNGNVATVMFDCDFLPIEVYDLRHGGEPDEIVINVAWKSLSASDVKELIAGLQAAVEIAERISGEEPIETPDIDTAPGNADGGDQVTA